MIVDQFEWRPRAALQLCPGMAAAPRSDRCNPYGPVLKGHDYHRPYSDSMMPPEVSPVLVQHGLKSGWGLFRCSRTPSPCSLPCSSWPLFAEAATEAKSSVQKASKEVVVRDIAHAEHLDQATTQRRPIEQQDSSTQSVNRVGDMSSIRLDAGPRTKPPSASPGWLTSRSAAAQIVRRSCREELPGREYQRRTSGTQLGSGKLGVNRFDPNTGRLQPACSEFIGCRIRWIIDGPRADGYSYSESQYQAAQPSRRATWPGALATTEMPL